MFVKIRARKHLIGHLPEEGYKFVIIDTTRIIYVDCDEKELRYDISDEDHDFYFKFSDKDFSEFIGLLASLTQSVFSLDN